MSKERDFECPSWGRKECHEMDLDKCICHLRAYTDEEWNQANIVLCLLKIKYYYWDSDMIDTSVDGEKSLITRMMNQLFYAEEEAQLIAEGDYSFENAEYVGGMGVFGWCDVLACLESICEIDDLIKQYFDELLAIREQMRMAFVRQSQSYEIDSNDDNKPQWGR